MGYYLNLSTGLKLVRAAGVFIFILMIILAATVKKGTGWFIAGIFVGVVVFLASHFGIKCADTYASMFGEIDEEVTKFVMKGIL